MSIIKMLETVKGSSYKIISIYKKDDIYSDLDPDLVEVLVNGGLAEMVEVAAEEIPDLVEVLVNGELAEMVEVAAEEMPDLVEVLVNGELAEMVELATEEIPAFLQDTQIPAKKAKK